MVAGAGTLDKHNLRVLHGDVFQCLAGGEVIHLHIHVVHVVVGWQHIAYLAFHHALGERHLVVHHRAGDFPELDVGSLWVGEWQGGVAAPGDIARVAHGEHTGSLHGLKTEIAAAVGHGGVGAAYVVVDRQGEGHIGSADAPPAVVGHLPIDHGQCWTLQVDGHLVGDVAHGERGVQRLEEGGCETRRDGHIVAHGGTGGLPFECLVGAELRAFGGSPGDATLFGHVASVGLHCEGEIVERCHLVEASCHITLEGEDAVGGGDFHILRSQQVDAILTTAWQVAEGVVAAVIDDVSLYLARGIAQDNRHIFIAAIRIVGGQIDGEVGNLTIVDGTYIEEAAPVGMFLVEFHRGGRHVECHRERQWVEGVVIDFWRCGGEEGECFEFLQIKEDLIAHKTGDARWQDEVL